MEPNIRDCKHGHLVRSCELCDNEREIAELRAVVARLVEAGEHTPSCNVRILYKYGDDNVAYTGRPCSCGWDAAVLAAKETR